MSKLVPIDQITEGMEIEQAVKNQYGQLLLPANTKIEERHKKILKTWGIANIYIKEEFNDSGDVLPSETQRLEELNLLYERFKWSPRNYNEEDLFEMVYSMKLKSNNETKSGS